jgi:hypothetical protein
MIIVFHQVKKLINEDPKKAISGSFILSKQVAIVCKIILFQQLFINDHLQGYVVYHTIGKNDYTEGTYSNPDRSRGKKPPTAPGTMPFTPTSYRPAA